jgi:hypothetical protein
MFNLSKESLFRKVYTDGEFLYRTTPETKETDLVGWIRKRDIPDYILKIILAQKIPLVGLTYILLDERKEKAIYYQRKCSFYDDEKQSEKFNKLYKEMFVDTNREHLLDKRFIELSTGVEVRVNIETGKYDQLWYPIQETFLREILPITEREYYDTIAKDVKGICYMNDGGEANINVAYNEN